MEQAVAGTSPISTGSHQDWSPPHPVRSRWGCVAMGNQGRAPGTSGTADPDSSASCSAFCRCRRHPLPQRLQTGQTDEQINTPMTNILGFYH